MPRKRRVPSLTHHKASGQGVVRLNGKDFYCGPWESDDTEREYDRLIKQWLANGRAVAAPTTPDYKQIITVAETIEAFWIFAQQRYQKAGSWRILLRTLNEMYGDEPAVQFGPVKLRAVMQALLDDRDKLTAGVARAAQWSKELRELGRQLIPAVHAGNPQLSQKVTIGLADVGISKMRSHRAQRMATVLFRDSLLPVLPLTLAPFGAKLSVLWVSTEARHDYSHPLSYLWPPDSHSAPPLRGLPVCPRPHAHAGRDRATVLRDTGGLVACGRATAAARDERPAGPSDGDPLDAPDSAHPERHRAILRHPTRGAYGVLRGGLWHAIGDANVAREGQLFISRRPYPKSGGRGGRTCVTSR